MARGGKREGAGRPKGAVNETTKQIRDLARKHTDAALLTLAEIMKDEAQSGPARVSAANAILDRGYGKPTQPISGDDEMPPIAHIIELVDLEGENSPPAEA